MKMARIGEMARSYMMVVVIVLMCTTTASAVKGL